MIRRAIQAVLAGAALGALAGCSREISRRETGFHAPTYGPSGPGRDLYREDSKVLRPEKK